MFFLLVFLVQCFCFDVESFKIEDSNLDLLKDCVLMTRFQNSERTPYNFIRNKMIEATKFDCQLPFGVADYVFHHVQDAYEDSECKILYEHMIEFELYPQFYQACKEISNFLFYLNAFINKFKYDDQIPPFLPLPENVMECLREVFSEDLDSTNYVEDLCSCFKIGSEKFSSPYCN